MAEYKVPQDVEAEDKLVGPLSFRQFIYAGIAAGGVAIGFFLFQVFPALAIIPLPIVLLFGALALPLRKDQPMETYLLAILRFYLKPKLRMWNTDGTITYVEITAPKVVEQHLTKDFTGQTAQERLDYLARVIDTRGWALKGVVQSKNSVRADVAAEAQTTNDIMDENAALSKSIAGQLAKKDQERKSQAVQQMQKAAQAPAQPQPAVPTATTTAPPKIGPAKTEYLTPQQQEEENTHLHYNPYPNSMHQKVVHTIEEQQEIADAKAKTKKAAEEATRLAKPAVPEQVSPDIMRLATSGTLSISAIANEAHRLQDKEEVVINLH